MRFVRGSIDPYVICEEPVDERSPAIGRLWAIVAAFQLGNPVLYDIDAVREATELTMVLPIAGIRRTGPFPELTEEASFDGFCVVAELVLHALEIMLEVALQALQIMLEVVLHALEVDLEFFVHSNFYRTGRAPYDG